MHKKQNKPRAVSFWMQPELGKEISERGDNRTLVIHRDLERLYTLYHYALQDISLSLQEAWFVVDILNGTPMDAETANMLWAEAEDACNLDGLDKKWSIDGKALVEKLKKLSRTQSLALIDAAERFWQANTGGMSDEELRKFFRPAICAGG